MAKVIGKPVEDLKPINGYLSYPQQVTSHVVSIETVDNTRTEDEKVFSIILTSSSGGADIDDSGSSKAKLTGKLNNVINLVCHVISVEIQIEL